VGRRSGADDPVTVGDVVEYLGSKVAAESIPANAYVEAMWAEKVVVQELQQQSSTFGGDSSNRSLQTDALEKILSSADERMMKVVHGMQQQERSQFHDAVAQLNAQFKGKVQESDRRIDECLSQIFNAEREMRQRQLTSQLVERKVGQGIAQRNEQLSEISRLAKEARTVATSSPQYSITLDEDGVVGNSDSSITSNAIQSRFQLETKKLQKRRKALEVELPGITERDIAPLESRIASNKWQVHERRVEDQLHRATREYYQPSSDIQLLKTDTSRQIDQLESKSKEAAAASALNKGRRGTQPRGSNTGIDTVGIVSPVRQFSSSARRHRNPLLSGSFASSNDLRRSPRNKEQNQQQQHQPKHRQKYETNNLPENHGTVTGKKKEDHVHSISSKNIGDTVEPFSLHDDHNAFSPLNNQKNEKNIDSVTALSRDELKKDNDNNKANPNKMQQELQPRSGRKNQQIQGGWTKSAKLTPKGSQKNVDILPAVSEEPPPPLQDGPSTKLPDASLHQNTKERNKEIWRSWDEEKLRKEKLRQEEEARTASEKRQKIRQKLIEASGLPEDGKDDSETPVFTPQPTPPSRVKGENGKFGGLIISGGSEEELALEDFETSPLSVPSHEDNRRGPVSSPPLTRFRMTGVLNKLYETGTANRDHDSTGLLNGTRPFSREGKEDTTAVNKSRESRASKRASAFSEAK